jgi:hypothetical protein
MFASGRGVLVSLLAMFVSRVSVLLRLFVLAEIMVMGGLMMMMRGGVVIRSSLMMMWPDALGTLPWRYSSQPVVENGCRL